MSKGESYRQILRSTSIVGGASVLNILIGLIRIKVAAVVLGPVGVGLIGLLNNLLLTAASVAALGTGTVGTRQVAEAAASADPLAIGVVRRAFVLGALVLAAAGTLVFWLLRDVLAVHVLADPSRAGDVGWLALGVGLTVMAGAHAALLNGLRRIGDLARVTVYSAVLSAVAGVAALLVWGERGLLVFLLLVPLTKFGFAQFYVARLPATPGAAPSALQLRRHWSAMARLGTAFMLAGLAGTLGQLLVRTLVQRELGADALGYFEAAWVISMTYIGFVLSAMGTDYYPRLTAVADDNQALNRLVNEQSEVALLLAGPVFLGMLGVAPWFVQLLYSAEFGDAAAILRWQILGDILKLMSWPLGFVMLAKGQGRNYMLSETFAMTVFVAGAWVGLPLMGLKATGISFLAMYIAYLPLVYWIVRSSTGFRWQREVLIHAAVLCATAAAVAVVASVHLLAGAVFGVLAATGFGIFGLGKLAGMGDLQGPLGRVGALARKYSAKIGLKNEY